MFKDLEQMARSTPFHWWKEPKEVNLVAVVVVYTFVLSLILSNRFQIEYQGTSTKQLNALTALLPSALGFTLIVMVIASVALYAIRLWDFGNFQSVASRLSRQLCLCMVFISIPFLFREIGALPTVLHHANLEYSGGNISAEKKLIFSLYYSSAGLILFWTTMLVRRHNYLSKLRKRNRLIIRYNAHYYTDPFIFGIVTSFLGISITHVTLWAQLPVWLSVVKP